MPLWNLGPAVNYCGKAAIRGSKEKSLVKVVTVALGALVLGLTIPTASSADGSADLFKQKCAMCHGENGAGKGKVPALSLAEIQQKTDADFKTAIEKGVKTDKGMMPGFGSKLTPEQIDEMLKYVRSLKK
jgi:mono/diheme cytochrome c family protein